MGRLREVVKLSHSLKLDENLEKTLSLADRWKKKGSLQDWASKYSEALSASFGKPKVTEEGGEVHLYAESGVASRFGVYVTHLSIIIIFIGAIVGNVLCFKGYVNIPEGESVSEVPVRGGSRMQPLGFTVKCNSFRVETYPTGQPKAYISDLSVIDGGREAHRQTIVVNDPLRYNGIWFYQSSYGQGGGATAQYLSLAPTEPLWGRFPWLRTSRCGSTPTVRYGG